LQLKAFKPSVSADVESIRSYLNSTLPVIAQGRQIQSDCQGIIDDFTKFHMTPPQLSGFRELCTEMDENQKILE
jgi:hypothetical protein